MVSSEELLRSALMVLIVTAVCLFGLLIFLWARPRRSSSSAAGTAPEAEAMDPGTLLGGLVGGHAGDSSVYEEMVRIATWAFLLSTAVIVAWSGLWPSMTAAIYSLLVVAALFFVIVHDLVPGAPFGGVRYGLEGLAAITVGGALVALTGGQQSPFFFVFPLIVGTVSLVVRPRSTFILAVVGIVTYVVTAYVGSGTPTVTQLVASMANVSALVLLGYAGSVIGRDQRRARDEAIRFSAADPLTGLFNRRLFLAALERELARSARSGRGFCLLMIDLDELHAINERGGHQAGDEALKAISDRMMAGVRKIDVAARYGGDEFVALLPETDPTGGWILAEKLRQSIAELRLPGFEVSPTVSIGVVAYPRDGDTAEALMIKADQAMFVSKRSGRNRVAGPLPNYAAGPASGQVVEPARFSGMPGVSV
ncbi:MAG: GGDEF domain-containing protein [Chloroflexota bacterium]